MTKGIKEHLLNRQTHIKYYPALHYSKKLHCIAEIRAYWVETKLLRLTTLDIITRLLDNVAFVCVHVVGRFYKISRSPWVGKSEGFSFRLNGLQQHCVRIYEKEV